MKNQSKDWVRVVRSQPKAASAASSCAKVPSTNATMPTAETRKTGLWMSKAHLNMRPTMLFSPILWPNSVFAVADSGMATLLQRPPKRPELHKHTQKWAAVALLRTPREQAIILSMAA